MDGLATTGLVTWLNSLQPQVEAAVISAVATAVGIIGTTVVGLAGFRHARRVANATLEGQRQTSIDERRFAVYEDAVKYLLRLTELRPEFYAFWPEINDSSPDFKASPPDHGAPLGQGADIDARIVAWASNEIRSLWQQMRDADDQVDVGRMQLRFRSGQTDFVPAHPIATPEELQAVKGLINDSTQAAHHRRQGVIEAIRKDLVGTKALK
ncbi:hypothetical protein ACIRSS_50045 [Amycolatopsis sp. NPDC101161]|uniref:hypothetical protein n=1 Tax=Amycolatopsis sp. NPDC101161 TaxID=3363940 RepID=UPI00382B603B